MKNTSKNTIDKLTQGFSFDFVIEVLLLLMVFLTPVLFDRRLGIVFSGTKIAWLRAFILITMSLWAIKQIITKEHRYVRTPLDWPVVSFLFATTIAALCSVHVYTSIMGFYGRFEGLSTWYIYGLLFFVTTNFIHSSKQLKRIIMATIPAATLMSIYSIIQRQGSDPYMWGGVITKDRVIGTIGQPNFNAAYVVMTFFLALVIFMERKNEQKSIDWYQQLVAIGFLVLSQVLFLLMIYSLDAQNVFLWYAGFGSITVFAILFAFKYEILHPIILEFLVGGSLVLMYISLLYTQSRGGYMGFFTGLVLFVLVAGRDWFFRNWKKVSILGLAILAISLITMLNPQYSPFERFVGEVSLKGGAKAAAETNSQMELKGAAGSRGETWKSAFKIVADHPFFGNGPEVMKMVFPRYETDLFRFKETFHVKQDRSHNETLDIPVTKGMFSFFIYLWIIISIYKIGFDKLKKANEIQHLMVAGLLAAITSYIIQNQFSFGVIAITSLFWIMWGMLVRIGCENETEPLKVTRPVSYWADLPWFSIAGVVVIAGILIYYSFLSFRTDVLFKSGKTNLEMRNLPLAISELSAALNILPFEGTTLSHLGIAYLNSGNSEGAVGVLKYGQKVDPYNADNFHMLSRYYLSMYDRGVKEKLVEARQNAQIALKIDPYYAEAFQTLGMIYEREGKKEEAAKMFQKTFMINPNLIDAMHDMERVSSPARVSQAYEEAYKKYSENLVVLEQIGRVYLEHNQIDKIGEVAEKMLNVDSEKPAGYLLSGEYQFRKGMIDKAFEAFQQALLLDPKNYFAHKGLEKVFRQKGDLVRAKEEAETAKGLK